MTHLPGSAVPFRETSMLPQIRLSAISGIHSPLLNCFFKLSPNKLGRSIHTTALGCDVGFESGTPINNQLLALINGAAETGIVFASILIIGVVL